MKLVIEKVYLTLKKKASSFPFELSLKSETITPNWSASSSFSSTGSRLRESSTSLSEESHPPLFFYVYPLICPYPKSPQTYYYGFRAC